MNFCERVDHPHLPPIGPADAWQHALDDQGQARPLEKAAVVELAGLLRESVGGDG
jgi:hypothetical protein